jgi:hypothetical protein
MAQDFAGAPSQEVMAAVVDQWMNLNTLRRGRLWYWQENRYAWERKFGETWGEILDNRSHRFIPAAFQAVETMVAQTMQGVMPNARFFKTVGRNQTAQRNSWSLEAKMRWDHYRLNFRSEAYRFIKAAAVDGNVPWTCTWRTEHALIPDEEMLAAKQQIQQHGIEVEVNDPAALGYPNKTVTSFEGAQLVVGDIFNYVQDRHPDDPRFAFRIYRSLQTNEWIQARWGDLKDPNGKPIYQNLDQLSNASYTNNEISDSLKRAIDRSIGYSPLPENKVELLTFCGDLIVPGGKFYHNCFGVIANRQVLLRFCYNPFAHGLPPWQMFTLIPDPEDPHGYGTGLVEPSLGLFDLINVRANQCADANSLAIQPPLAVVLDGITDTHNIVWGPMEQLYMRSQGNIQALPVPKDSLQLGLQEIQYYKTEIASTVGNVAGAPQQDSATASAGLQKSMGAVNAEMMQRVQDEGLIPILRMQASLNQSLMDPQSKVMVRLFVDETGVIQNPANGEILSQGVHWTDITASDIQGEFDYEIIGESAINQTQQQQQAQQNFIQTVSQSPQFGPYINIPEFMKNSMEKLGFTDAWRYVKTDQQVQQEQALAKQQQQSPPPQPSGNSQGASGAPQGGPPPNGHGVPSVPGDAGGGGSPARTPYPQQLAGPSRIG